MPFELSVNLEYGFTEAGEKIEDRIAAAAAAGFRKVELFLLKGRDLAAIKAALDAHGVALVSTVADYATQLVDPATHDDFCNTFREAATAAKSLGCANVVVTSGAACRGSSVRRNWRSSPMPCASWCRLPRSWT